MPMLMTWRYFFTASITTLELRKRGTPTIIMQARVQVRFDQELRENLLHDAAMDIGEAEVAAIVAIGEFFVIEAEQVQDGGVEVVHVDLFGDGVVAELVG